MRHLDKQHITGDRAWPSSEPLDNIDDQHTLTYTGSKNPAHHIGGGPTGVIDIESLTGSRYGAAPCYSLVFFIRSVVLDLHAEFPVQFS